VLRELADFEAEHGLSLREDLAATLGGDFAIAFDGPWLPTPSWKLVLEVADAGRLPSTLVRRVEEWNRAAATSGKSTMPIGTAVTGVWRPLVSVRTSRPRK
jgi:hypothetical protein